MQGIGYTTEHDVLRWLLEQTVWSPTRGFYVLYLPKELYEQACKIAGIEPKE